MSEPIRNTDLSFPQTLINGNKEHKVSDPDHDHAIWESFKKGSQNTLSYIFRNYSDLLFNYGYQFTGDRSLIKDCLQDVFFDLIKHRRNLNSTNSIKFYLMRCMRNKVVNALQKVAKSKTIEAESFKEDEPFKVAISTEVKMINGQLNTQKQSVIQKKINELPPLQREAILLYFYEGLKYAEIAVMMGIKVKSSRALIYRSLESLKGMLSPYQSTLLSMGLIMTLLI